MDNVTSSCSKSNPQMMRILKISISLTTPLIRIVEAGQGKMIYLRCANEFARRFSKKKEDARQKKKLLVRELDIHDQFRTTPTRRGKI